MQESLKVAIASSKSSQFLDSALYREPEMLDFELKHIFRKTWLYVGELEELAEPGNVSVKTIAFSSILFVRDRDGQLRAFHNICPHRGAAFQSTEGCNRLKHLVCPYHGWVYDLTGELIGTPGIDRFPKNFQREDYPLRSLRLEQWGKFTFISFDESVPSLLEFLGEIPFTIGKHHTPATKLLLKKQYQVPCNWKIYHDNTLCDYHVAITHRKTLHPIQGPIRNYQHRFGKYINLLYTPTTESWRSQNQILDSLTADSRTGFFTYGIFPNLHLLAFPNGIIAWLRIEPLSVKTNNVELEIYGIPGISPNEANLIEDFETFMFEDMSVTEGVQQGYESEFFTPGPVNELEARIVHHQELIRQYLIAGLKSDDI
jgi:phenylpropionate dioxygenase-like ring-hydroxylating dioxygenase large terminal subunit